MALANLAEKLAITQGKRRVLLTEVTRMKGGLVCVAGIDIDNHQMVRPLQPGGRNWEETKWVETAYMEVGNILNLTPANEAESNYPHRTEDFWVSQVGLLGKADWHELHVACIETAFNSINDLFNHFVVDNKFVHAGTQCRSLGCVMVPAPTLRVSGAFDKVQVSYPCGLAGWQNLPVTDLTVKNCQDSITGAALIQQRLGEAGNSYVALRIGLARAWDGPDHTYDPKRCYIQLNGLITPG